MDASQLFSRCMRQLLSQQPGCLHSSRVSTAPQYILKRNLRCSTQHNSLRSFTSSTQHLQGDAFSVTPRPGDREAGAGIENDPIPGSDTSSPHVKRQENTPTRRGALHWRPGAQDASKQLDALLQRQTQNNPSTSGRASNSLPDVSAMLDELTWGRSGGPPKKQSIALRMRPTLGRQVEVESYRGIDVTRAFQMLENKCNKGGNSVKADERNQRTHIRAGQKKKILRRSRWRTLFQQGFLQECARVRKMIKQGW